MGNTLGKSDWVFFEGHCFPVSGEGRSSPFIAQDLRRALTLGVVYEDTTLSVPDF